MAGQERRQGGSAVVQIGLEAELRGAPQSCKARAWQGRVRKTTVRSE